MQRPEGNIKRGAMTLALFASTALLAVGLASAQQQGMSAAQPGFSFRSLLAGAREAATACSTVCDSGFCCSQWGFCGGVAGNDDAWCGAGCQPDFTPDNGCYSGNSASTPAPFAAPAGTPAPTSAGPVTDQVQGYYSQTWQTKTAPPGTNLGVAFGGYVDVGTAISDAASTAASLVGVKFLNVGGGNDAGKFTGAAIDNINAGFEAIKNAGYAGICYDIEVGDAGLGGAFADSFAQAKGAGLLVYVTVSHSQPYGITDAADVMSAILGSPNVDYLSPQLYTSGDEAANDWTAIGTQWTAYAGTSAKVVPSIVNGGYYGDAQATFATYGVTTYGYVAWA